MKKKYFLLFCLFSLIFNNLKSQSINLINATEIPEGYSEQVYDYQNIQPENYTNYSCSISGFRLKFFKFQAQHDGKFLTTFRALSDDSLAGIRILYESQAGLNANESGDLTRLTPCQTHNINSGFFEYNVEKDKYYYLVVSYINHQDTQPFKFSVQTPSDVSSYERQQLMDFATAAGYENWVNNEGWGTDAPVSDWYGISRVENNQVTVMAMQNNNFTGSISPSLGNLNALRSVFFSGGNLTGKIPASLANSSLTTIDLGFHNLSGDIPIEVLNHPNQTLVIRGNRFDFNQYQDFYSAGNDNGPFSFFNPQFYGTPKTELVSIGQTVTLNQNTVGSPSPATYTWYKSLIDEDYLKSQNTSNFPNDDVIQVAQSSNPSYELSIDDYDDYGVYFCVSTNADFDGINIFSQPVRVGIAHEDHPDYNALLALYNALDGSNWGENSWDLEGDILTWAGLTFHDAPPYRVKSIAFSSTSINGTIPSEIGDLSMIESIEIIGANLTGSIPPEIGQLTNLTYLSFFQSNLSGEVPSELWDLTNLQSLFLGYTQLTLPNGLPNEINNLQNLNWLNLSGIPLSLPLNTELFNIPSLSILRLDDCNLTGPIPYQIGQIRNVRMSNNNLSGPIPQEIINSTLDNRQLHIENNLFSFSDLEPLGAVSANFVVLSYSPQRITDQPSEENANVGSEVVLFVDLDLINDSLGKPSKTTTTDNYTFQWLKNGEVIAGATSNPYTLENVQPEDSGDYTCQVFNSILPDLVIESAPISVIVGTLSLEDIQNENTVLLYPNPSEDIVFFNKSFKQIDIYNAIGKSISAFKDVKEINISNIKSGLYILKLTDYENKIYNKRLIIK